MIMQRPMSVVSAEVSIAVVVVLLCVWGYLE
jgi:hypothetical protein